MITLDGIEYSIKTASENTRDMLDRINAYCEENKIVNSKGELVRIDENYASPIYMILWGLGYLVTLIQNLLYSLGKCFSIQDAPDSALLNLADMAGIKRGKPSVTTFSVYVQAMTKEDENYDESVETCTITSDNVITYQGVTYRPALHPSLVLQPGDSAYITMVADTVGSNEIAEESLAGFDTPVVNLRNFVQSRAVPGQPEESIADLRARLQRRTMSGTSVDNAMDAIRALPGITLCNIFYNTNVNGDVQMGSDAITVPPRHALCLIQGYNDKVAQTFYNYLTAPSITVENVGAQAASRIVEVQEYVSHAGQKIPLVLVAPRQVPLYISVYLGAATTTDIVNQMKTAVCQVAEGLTAGQVVTSAMILEKLEPFKSYDVLGVGLADNEMDTTGSYTTGQLKSQAADVLWIFNTNNIFVDMPI